MKPDENGLDRQQEFPIGEIRRRLFVGGSDPWNGFVRDKTAEMELEWYRRFPRTAPEP